MPLAVGDQLAESPSAIAAKADAIVSLRSIHKSFGRLKVLEGVSLDFKRGSTTVIMGPSGTGKSVLLKHVVGLLKPDRGEVYFEGKRIDKLPERMLVEMRTKFGFLFQMGALFDSLNVEQNITFPLAEHTKMTAEQLHDRCTHVLSLVGLSDTAKKMPAELSGGQRKRIALARAIALHPAVILYDEPTTGLDPIRADVINELIIKLKREMHVTSIVVTHDMTSAFKIADRILMLYDGHIVADGTAEDFHNSKHPVVKSFVEGKADAKELAAITGTMSP